MRKKTFSILLLALILLSITSCTNKYIEKEHGVTLTVDDEYRIHLLNQNNIPEVTFLMDNVRISDQSTQSHVVFVRNDQYKLSDAFSNHLSTYDENKIAKTRSEQRDEKGYGRIGSDKLKLDEGTKSMEEIITVNLEDGSRVSYSYRTFVSGGKRYYAYSYTDNISMSLEQPFMVVKENGENKLVLLPLPYDTKYMVGSNITVDKLINKDTYLNTSEEDYYVFNYSTYIKNHCKTDEECKRFVESFYINYCNGAYIDEKLQIEYLGIKFIVDFNQTKINKQTNTKEAAFKLIYEK